MVGLLCVYTVGHVLDNHGWFTLSLDNTTSITLPPSQRPHPSSTATVPADTSSRVPDKDDLLHCSTADLPHREDDNSALYEDTQSQGTSISKLEQKPSDTAPLDNPQAVSNIETELAQSRKIDFTENQSTPQTVPVKEAQFPVGEGLLDSSQLSADPDSLQQQISAISSFPLLFLPRTKPQKTPKKQKKRKMY